MKRGIQNHFFLTAGFVASRQSATILELNVAMPAECFSVDQFLSLKEFRCKSGGKCQTRKGEKCRSCRLDTCIKENLDISLIQFPSSYNFKKMKDWLSKKRRELMPNNFVKHLSGQQNMMKNLKLISNCNNNGNIIDNNNGNIIKTNLSQLLTNNDKINVDLEMLLSTENKALKLRQSPNNLLLEYLFTKNLENLIESKTNVLDFIELFGMNGKQLIINENLFKEGKNLPTIGNYQNLDFLLEVEIMRKLPIFDKIPFEDKICLFRSNIHRLVTLSNCFQSVQMGESSVTYPNGLCPGDFCKNLFERIFSGKDLNRYFFEPNEVCVPKSITALYQYLYLFVDLSLVSVTILIISNLIYRYQVLRRRAFTDIISEFKPYNLTQQEYVLLKTILFCNSIPENISQNSKNLLKLEAERYGQILMKYLQNLLGNFKGAMRHADCLLFIGKIFEYNMQQNIFYKMVDEKIFYNNERSSRLIMERPIFVEQCLFKFPN
uniref:NR LBD domain-containing protein n=1 Tax=Meloidogyne enterolobii TaxID=390850 RepID=A0A6V7WQ51_MELEN|nr:unnamed protein product [Meloidogyne enterolobii]